MGIPTKELAALSILNRHCVDYLVIGGYAMRFYGADRAAKDVDLWADNSPTNSSKLYTALEEIIGKRPAFRLEDLLGAEFKQVRLKKDGYALEVLTNIVGMDFGAAHGARARAVDESVPVPVVSREHLLLMKKIAATRDVRRREQEGPDIQFLEGGHVDETGVG